MHFTALKFSGTYTIRVAVTALHQADESTYEAGYLGRFSSLLSYNIEVTALHVITAIFSPCSAIHIQKLCLSKQRPLIAIEVYFKLV